MQWCVLLTHTYQLCDGCSSSGEDCSYILYSVDEGRALAVYYVFAVQEEVVVTWNPHRQDVDLPWTMGMMSTMLRSRLIHMDHRVEDLSIHLQAQADIQALVNQYVLVVVVSRHMFDFSRFIINHMCFL